jgi:hypothetical protein
MTVIVAPVANRPECMHALDVAFDLSARVGGQVVGYHLHPHEHDSKKIRRPNRPSKEAFGLFEEMAGKAGIPIKNKITTASGPAAHWREMVGSPDKVMPIIGPLSDIFVVSRPKGSGKGSQGKLAQAFMLEALRSSGRPTLILPQRKLGALGKRVLITWDQSTGSVQALIGALPILKQADDVVIHSAGADFRAAPKASHAKSFLAMHNIKARIKKSKGLHVEQEIEQAYDDHNADLLVMGAYSRPRFLENLLGGTSEHFIIGANIPVLATHPPA